MRVKEEAVFRLTTPIVPLGARRACTSSPGCQIAMIHRERNVHSNSNRTYTSNQSLPSALLIGGLREIGDRYFPCSQQATLARDLRTSFISDTSSLTVSLTFAFHSTTT